MTSTAHWRLDDNLSRFGQQDNEVLNDLGKFGQGECQSRHDHGFAVASDLQSKSCDAFDDFLIGDAVEEDFGRAQVYRFRQNHLPFNSLDVSRLPDDKDFAASPYSGAAATTFGSHRQQDRGRRLWPDQPRNQNEQPEHRQQIQRVFHGEAF